MMKCLPAPLVWYWKRHIRWSRRLSSTQQAGCSLQISPTRIKRYKSEHRDFVSVFELSHLWRRLDLKASFDNLIIISLPSGAGYKSTKCSYHPSGTRWALKAHSLDWPANQLGKQFLIEVLARLGSLLFGYDLGVIAQVIAPGGNVMTVWNPLRTMCEQYRCLHELTQAKHCGGMVVSLLAAGAFCGAGLAAPPWRYSWPEGHNHDRGYCILRRRYRSNIRTKHVRAIRRKILCWHGMWVSDNDEFSLSVRTLPCLCPRSSYSSPTIHLKAVSAIECYSIPRFPRQNDVSSGHLHEFGWDLGDQRKKRWDGGSKCMFYRQSKSCFLLKR